MIVVYTAIFGASDSLKQAPAGADRCICLTDDVTLSGRGWEMRYRPTPTHPRQAARAVKLASDVLFPEASLVVWVDGSIEIRDWARLMADVAKAELACLPHPDRDTCYDEGRKVVQLKIAHADQVNAALEEYRQAGFTPRRLATTGLLVRRQTPRVAAFNALWRDHVARYGTNDQVHVDYCAWRAGLTMSWLTGHYRDNPYMRYDQQDHHRRRRPQFLPDREGAA